MRHDHSDTRQSSEITKIKTSDKYINTDDFVLEKSIFANIFEKDIRRVFIYKKAERLAKAIHLITPAFTESVSLKNRIDAIAVALIDAAILPPGSARTALPRELLALSSMLSIASTTGTLSRMNAELITREAHILLHEIAAYEEPRLSFADTPTLSEIAKNVISRGEVKSSNSGVLRRTIHRPASTPQDKGHIKDIGDITDSHIKDRRETILSVIKDKGSASIKDISTLIRDVSEKTIQRELLALIEEGKVLKQGERRWSMYSLV